MPYLCVMDHEPEPVLSEAEEDLLIYTSEPGNWRRYYLAHPQGHAEEPVKRPGFIGGSIP
jgi:hypothetical protein